MSDAGQAASEGDGLALTWRRRPLGVRALLAGDCPHGLGGAGRETLAPVVRLAPSGAGDPGSSRVVARPGDPIRRCCLEASCPVAIARFWASVRRRSNEATLRIGLAREVFDPLEAELWRDRHRWLWAELEKVVRRPTVDESRLYDLFERDEPLPAGADAADFAAKLSAAEARLAAYLKSKRRGEHPIEWWLRVEPPRGYDKKCAARQRRADAALFAEAFGNLHYGAGWRERRGSWQERAEAARAAVDADGAVRGAPQAAKALGLPWPCTAAELKAAWRRAALEAHPDHGGTPETFRSVKAAHDELVRALGAA